jgi:hypothetical protein
VHKATVNGRLVPLCDQVMVVSPEPTRGGPTAVIPHSASSARTSAWHVIFFAAAECHHHECGQPWVVAGIRAVGLATLTPPGRLHSVCWADRISAARSPMMTQGAMVFPVVTRGMIDPSAMRRCSIP